MIVWHMLSTRNGCLFNFSMIYNDDFRNILPDIDRNSVDLILTDPPYNANRTKCSNWNIRENHAVRAQWDRFSDDSYMDLISDFFKQSAQVLKEGGTLITFCYSKDVSDLIRIGEENGFYFKNVITWHKTNPFPGNMNIHFAFSTEFIIYFVYSAKCGTFNNNGKVIHNFIETSITPKREKKYGKHQTQKPLEVIKWLVEILSNEGDLVLDPFMGTGTTCLACKELNRNYIGIELQQEFYEIAEKRLSD